MTTMKTPTTTELENTVQALSTVTTVAEGTELPESVSESILAAVESYLVGADEGAEVRPYLADEHTVPVRLRKPLTVVTAINAKELAPGDYLVHVAGASYRDDYPQAHPMAQLFTRHGRKGAHGLPTVPPWAEVRIGDAHIIGRSDTSEGGSRLPSGNLASRLGITLRITVGQPTVERQLRIPRGPEQVPTIAWSKNR